MESIGSEISTICHGFVDYTIVDCKLFASFQGREVTLVLVDSNESYKSFLLPSLSINIVIDIVIFVTFQFSFAFLYIPLIVRIT